MDYFVNALRHNPELAIFLTLALGYYFGKFTFKGIGLGAVTATLLAGVLIGQIGITINQPLKAFSFLMFLFAVGYASWGIAETIWFGAPTVMVSLPVLPRILRFGSAFAVKSYAAPPATSSGHARRWPLHRSTTYPSTKSPATTSAAIHARPEAADGNFTPTYAA